MPCTPKIPGEKEEPTMKKIAKEILTLRKGYESLWRCGDEQVLTFLCGAPMFDLKELNPEPGRKFGRHKNGWVEETNEIL